jgi:HEAT repeat protein
LGDTEAIPALEKAMGDGDPLLRAACAGALGGLEGGRDASRLSAMLEGERDDRVRAAARLGASSCQSPDSDEGEATIRAALELFEGLAGARSPGLRRQYAIGLANVLGKSGEFLALATGDEGGRLARGQAVFEALARRLDTTAGDLEGTETIMAGLRSAWDGGDGRASLELVLEAHRRVLRKLFGASAAGELDQLLLRADARLAAWHATVLAAGASLPDLEPEAATLLALIGAWYLSSE